MQSTTISGENTFKMFWEQSHMRKQWTPGCFLSFYVASEQGSTIKIDLAYFKNDHSKSRDVRLLNI